MTTGPYAQAAHAYWAAGWRGILPLPPKAKKLPPRGFTGESGIDPSWADVQAWLDSEHGAGNIALRLPRHVLGIDVDNYGDKRGGDTLHQAEQRWGALPPTFRTTSRDDGISGIRLYRIPEGLAWPGELDGGSTELIQWRHRYAVVWPSLHPEGRTYRWINPDGVVSTAIPDVDTLPPLPDIWVTGLTGGQLATETNRNTYTSAATGQWLATRPGAADSPCTRMARAVEQTVFELTGVSPAHNGARDGALRAVRLADEGHAGLVSALVTMRTAFINNATSSRRTGQQHQRTPAEADREWTDLVTSAVNLVTANPSGDITCDCAGQLTGLITGSNYPTVGNVALAALPAAAPESTAAPAAEPDAPEHTSWWPRDLEPILAGRDDEPGPAVLTRSDGAALFYRGKVNGLLGESESGKTWVALLAVTQQLADARSVVYLDFEDTPTGIVARLRALGATDSDLTRLHYIGPEETLHAAASDDLRGTLSTHQPDLIILDGFNAAMTLLGLDLDNNKDATQFAQILLRPLAGTGACVVYVDHVPKNKESRGKGGIGAQAKRAMTTGCALSVDVLSPFGRGMTGRLKLTVDKDRPGHVRAVSDGAKHAGVAVLDSEPETLGVTVRIRPADGEDGSPKPDIARAQVMERISDWLFEAPANTSSAAIERGVGGKAVRVREALAELVAGEYVSREDAPNGGYRHTLQRRFSLADVLTTSHLVPSSQPRPNLVPDEGVRSGVNLVPSSPSLRGDEDEDDTTGFDAIRFDPDTGEVIQ